MTLKTGLQMSETILVRLAQTGIHPDSQQWIELIAAIALELTKEINARERLYPSLKIYFDCEMQQYRTIAEATQESINETKNNL